MSYRLLKPGGTIGVIGLLILIAEDMVKFSGEVDPLTSLLSSLKLTPEVSIVRKLEDIEGQFSVLWKLSYLS